MSPQIHECSVFDPIRLHRLAPHRYPHFVQSSAASGEIGRFDIVFAFPGDSLVLCPDGRLTGARKVGGNDFLSALDQWWQNDHEQLSVPVNLPFVGGWFLYLGYELAEQIEPSLKLPVGSDLPTAFATRIPVTAVIDHAKSQAFVVSEPGYEFQAAEMLRDVEQVANSSFVNESQLISHLFEDPPEEFVKAVNTAKELIFRGDIYQANLSRAWRGELFGETKAIDLYEKLRVTNPAPFSGFLSWEDATIVSSSPERLLRIKEGIADTRPIAGTRPRGGHEDEDKRLSEELFAHPKERAEHTMLIDLERNDLGRICEPGTVKVSEMMVLESYKRVHHIVSNVTGKVKPDVLPGQAIRAVFPGGTITGCPKVRCMEIIAELEGAPREAYTGSFGYLNHDGSMDLNILIRTFQVRGKSVSLRAGAGIVADSDPQAELMETRAKASAMIEAVEAS
ncbi:MAG: aminodeoxychorismate synthase component I [Pseudomonadota bacterium]